MANPFLSLYKFCYQVYYFISVGFFRLPADLIANASRSGERRYAFQEAILLSLSKHVLHVLVSVNGGVRGQYLSQQTDAERTRRFQSIGSMPDVIAGVEEQRLKGHIAFALRVLAEATEAPRNAAEVAQSQTDAKFKSSRDLLAKPVPVGIFWTGERASKLKQSRAQPGEKVVLWLHGGYYFLGTAETNSKTAYSTLTLDYLDASRRAGAAASAGSSILAIEYRKSDRAPWPAPLIDALAGWNYLTAELDFRPENVILMGESAGAHLALALTRYLKENLDVLPGANILACPYLDLTGALAKDPKGSAAKNAAVDWLSPVADAYARAKLVPEYLGSSERKQLLQSTYLSPSYPSSSIYGAEGKQVSEASIYENWCRTFVFVGTNDILFDHSDIHERRFRLGNNGKVSDKKFYDRFDVAGAPHAFHMLPPPSFASQRKEAADRAVRWISSV
ncbi:alpha/beta-hydrolase [Ceraceosorus guamensis]|uniref:Alpha/beta-hydrolase n=1 Tax=Ceraceosorus guamensis TaxID=1522189 RepID=A0A316VRV7_9BASI|nr:alpha/beta-hydrolase [Ceraceosorus guamensis]PWN40242.1 alpha/beta-hydrolase [Ceraceosorus guamensis]